MLIKANNEFNISANYPKAHGDEFHEWLKRYCPGKQFLPVIRVCGSSRQDSAFDGAHPVYDSLDEMIAFTNECLICGEKILHHCLFLALGSEQIVTRLQNPTSGYYYSTALVCNMHTLLDCDWGSDQ